MLDSDHGAVMLVDPVTGETRPVSPYRPLRPLTVTRCGRTPAWASSRGWRGCGRSSNHPLRPLTVHY
eukprot:1935439-Pyramimonas_sp.AAC.1